MNHAAVQIARSARAVRLSRSSDPRKLARCNRCLAAFCRAEGLTNVRIGIASAHWFASAAIYTKRATIRQHFAIQGRPLSAPKVSA